MVSGLLNDLSPPPPLPIVLDVIIAAYPMTRGIGRYRYDKAVCRLTTTPTTSSFFPCLASSTSASLVVRPVDATADVPLPHCDDSRDRVKGKGGEKDFSLVGEGEGVKGGEGGGEGGGGVFGGVGVSSTAFSWW